MCAHKWCLLHMGHAHFVLVFRMKLESPNPNGVNCDDCVLANAYEEMWEMDLSHHKSPNPTESLVTRTSRLWQGWDSETSGEKSISEILVIMIKLVSWVMDCTKVQTQWLLEWLLSVKVHRDFYQWPISILIGYLYVYLLYYISSLHNSTAVVACCTTDHWVAGSNPLRGVFVFNVTSLFPVLSSVQLCIHNVYTGGLTNIISFSFLYIPAVITK